MAADTGEWKRGVIPKGSPLYDEHGQIMGHTSADAHFVSAVIAVDPAPAREEPEWFPNLARKPAKEDDEAVTAVARAELEASGIEVHQGLCQPDLEVPTRVVGILREWSFRRSWCYWVAQGPGLPPAVADALHVAHGKDVRVMGHAGAPSPREYLGGFACGLYHVDTPAGLAALAAALRAVGTEEAWREEAGR